MKLMTAARAALLMITAPAYAQDEASPLGATPVQVAPTQPATPPVTPTWPGVFAAIHVRDWTGAGAALDLMPPGPLTPLARAEIYLGSGAPGVDAATLTALLASARDLPEAPALAVLARARGATTVPALPAQQPLLRIAGASKRQAARAGRADAAYARLAAAVQPLLKSGDVASAETLVEAASADLPPEALTEWRQRLAWSAFQAGDDATARRVADVARAGDGDWATQAAWVAGLAAWRTADYSGAATAFAQVANRANDGETSAAGLYWQARAVTASGQPQSAAPLLRAAASRGETFYGMLAGTALGIRPAAVPVMVPADPVLHSNLAGAAALVSIGETGLADALLRQQARIGQARDHAGLIAFAGSLGLPETQMWLAQNCPAGAQSAPYARYPMPAWRPSGGWRVDRALMLAHALQESQFRTDAVSRTGARGLMQLMPGTARLVARHKGDPFGAEGRMGDPALNFEYGQSYLEELAGHAGTGGLLPKVIAAYNAGPNNVALWNLKTQVQADPLLFIEAIPFAETRAYVAIVLRNYWMYQRETGAATASLSAMAQGRWPRFPGQAVARSAARATGGDTASN